MKIKFLATGLGPEKYEFDGEKIIVDGDVFDLSFFEEGDRFDGIDHPIMAIREVERVEGELFVLLCQKSPIGHWTGQGTDYIDAKDYDLEKLYIREKTPDEIKEVGA